MVFQTSQTESQAGQLPRSQCQRGEVAGLHGTAGVCAAALHGAPVGMGAQLHAVVCRYAFGLMGADRLVSLVEILWDSKRTIQSDRSAQHRMVAGFCANQNISLWDSISE